MDAIKDLLLRKNSNKISLKPTSFFFRFAIFTKAIMKRISLNGVEESWKQ